MDDFQPEDELKPDTSDRPGRRKNRPVAHEHKGATRQYLMTGIGIVVLLLIIVGIGAAINGPKNKEQKTDHPEPTTVANNTEPKPLAVPAIQESGSNTHEQEQATSATARSEPNQSFDLPAAGLPVSAAALDRTVKIPATPTTAKPVQNEAVTATATATKAEQKPAVAAAQREAIEKQRHKKVVKEHTLAKRTTQGSSATQSSTATGNYTLQLSGATSKSALVKWATAQRLKSFQVIETQRHGKAWFILVSGRYSSPAAAKKAIVSLPAAVQAKSPWVKSLKP
jgi:DamX protein